MRASKRVYFSYIWLFLLEVILFLTLFFSGVYRSVMFSEIFESISSLPDVPLLSTTLILLVMSVPILIIVYLLNFRFFKVTAPQLLIIHAVFVITCISVLELLLRTIN